MSAEIASRLLNLECECGITSAKHRTWHILAMMLRGLPHISQAKRIKMYYIGNMMAESVQANTTAEKTEGCTKCGATLDTKGYPLWCKKCQAAYRRDYSALRKEMSESRGYAAGVSAFRDHIARKFEAIGTSATFNGSVAAKWVRGEQISMPQD